MRYNDVMSLIILFLMSALSAGTLVWFSQGLLRVKRSRQRNIRYLVIFTLLSAAGSVAAEMILKAGRPTFYYHTHRPGSTTLKIFALGCLLAWLGLAVLLLILERKQLRQSVPVLLQKSLVIALFAAVIAELFFFNMRHYELIGTDAPQISLSGDRFVGGGLYFNRADWKWHSYDGSGTPQLTAYFSTYPKVRNIRFEFDDDTPQTRVQISYDDQSHSKLLGIPEQHFIRGIDRSFSVPLHTVGSTYMMKFLFPEKSHPYEFSLQTVKLNSVVPLEIMPVRFGLCTLLFFLICVFFPGSLLWKLPLDLKSFGQRLSIGLLLLSVCLFLIWTAVSNYSGSSLSVEEQKRAWSHNHEQYQRLTEALANRSYALLQIPDHKLPRLSDPYDYYLREDQKVPYLWDTAYYDGNYYVYYGVVPAVSILLPYYLITGEHLDLDHPLLLCAILTVIALYGTYRTLVLRFYGEMNFALYFLGFCLLLQPLSLTQCTRRALVYETAIVSGVCLGAWAILFALHAAGHPLCMFLCGSCAALAVGCRPTMILVSLPVITILFLRAKESGRPDIPGILCFLIPYAAVGAALMKYNYARFGNVFEFGQTYQLTTLNHAVSQPRLGPTGVILSVLGLWFTPPQIDMNFPFVHAAIPQITYNGLLEHTDRIIGLFAFPFMGLLFLKPFLNRDLRQRGRLLSGFCHTTVLSGIVLSGIAGSVSVNSRYLCDFAWLFALTAALLLFSLYRSFAEKGAQTVVEGAVMIIFLVGLVLFLSISVTGEAVQTRQGSESWFKLLNPLLYEKIRYACSPWL